MLTTAAVQPFACTVVNPKSPASQTPTAVSLPLGETFAGHYQICSLLGKGGMGSVFKARHQLLDRHVAIKIVHDEHASAIARFQREAQAATRLRHPNIVAVHEFGSANNRLYMVMDEIEGESVEEMLNFHPRLPIAEAVEIAVQICAGVHHAHQNAILHRDLKPSNIMVSRTQTGAPSVRIVDFGIAKFIDDDAFETTTLTNTGEFCGSPLYMSPEQALGRSADERSDVYSIGCVLFEMLTGTPPFMGASFMSTLSKHVQETPLTLHEASLGEEFPERLEAVVARCLQKRPEHRFQSAEELRIALMDSLNMQPAFSAAPPQRRVPRQEFDVMVLVMMMMIVAIGIGTCAAVVGEFVPECRTVMER